MTADPAPDMPDRLGDRRAEDMAALVGGARAHIAAFLRGHTSDVERRMASEWLQRAEALFPTGGAS